MTPLNYHNLSVHASSSVSSAIGKTSSQLKDLHGLSLDKIVWVILIYDGESERTSRVRLVKLAWLRNIQSDRAERSLKRRSDFKLLNTLKGLINRLWKFTEKFYDSFELSKCLYIYSQRE